MGRIIYIYGQRCEACYGEDIRRSLHTKPRSERKRDVKGWQVKLQRQRDRAEREEREKERASTSLTKM
jgi:hypothetical protein